MLASHLTHGDETALGDISERGERSTEEQNAVYFAQYLRILSDVYHMTLFLRKAISCFLGLDYDNLADDELDLIKKVHEKYKDIVFSDPLYDKYKGNKN